MDKKIIRNCLHLTAFYISVTLYFIHPIEKRSHYVIPLGLRPSVRPFVRPSVTGASNYFELIIIGQKPITLAVGAGWDCLDIFSRLFFSFLFPCLGDNQI